MKMATNPNRSWKLQDFMAHNANVNCVALGHKSGHVMVTGGDDKKVNLWAIGKQSCFMSLSGHTTPIECVQFNPAEELVCAGSRAGALKVWDLEAAKLVRTLNGHKNSIKCVDFPPYGYTLASGGADSTIKVWDSRRKGCIFTYNGHKGTVNSVKFSPDGHWIASGSDDSTVKIWDLRIGRVLKEFGGHLNSVNSVAFHPHEFLLASGGADRTVQLFDLENFNVVSSERDLGMVRCITFNPDGECLFAGVGEYLKVIGWEPNRVFDSVPVHWGRVSDMSVVHKQLIGASFHLTNVQVFVVDLKRVQPLGSSTTDNAPSPFTPNQSIRKSFSKAERPVSLKNRMLDVKPIEESTSGTDPEEDASAVVTNLTDYKEIFKGRGLTRTPPPDPEPFQQPEHDYPDPPECQILSNLPSESFEALSLDNNINSYNPQPPVISTKYSRSKSNLDQVYISRLVKHDSENIMPNLDKNKSIQQPQSTSRYTLQRQSSCKDVPENTSRTSSIIKHSISDVNISKSSLPTRNYSRKNSFSRSNRNSSVPNVSKIANLNNLRGTDRSLPLKAPPPFISNSQVDIYANRKISPDNSPMEEEEFVPVSVDKPVGLDMDDFLPKNNLSLGFPQQLPDMSEAEVLGGLTRGHQPMVAMLTTRQRSLKLVLAQYRSKDMKAATESALAMGDLAIFVDLLGVINSKYNLWSLDMCVLVLPKVEELLQSKFEKYMTTGCNTLRLILRNFGPLIKSNIQSPCGSFGVDLMREERYRKSVKCHEILTNLKFFLNKKQTMPGSIGHTFREITTLMQTTLD